MNNHALFFKKKIGVNDFSFSWILKKIIKKIVKEKKKEEVKTSNSHMRFHIIFLTKFSHTHVMNILVL